MNVRNVQRCLGMRRGFLFSLLLVFTGCSLGLDWGGTYSGNGADANASDVLDAGMPAEDASQQKVSTDAGLCAASHDLCDDFDHDGGLLNRGWSGQDISPDGGTVAISDAAAFSLPFALETRTFAKTFAQIAKQFHGVPRAFSCKLEMKIADPGDIAPSHFFEFAIGHAGGVTERLQFYRSGSDIRINQNVSSGGPAKYHFMGTVLSEWTSVAFDGTFAPDAGTFNVTWNGSPVLQGETFYLPNPIGPLELSIGIWSESNAPMHVFYDNVVCDITR